MGFPPRNPNEYVDLRTHHAVIVHSGPLGLIRFLVDTADVDLLQGRHWQVARYAEGCVYANSDGRHLMHRVLLGSVPRGLEVDHINGDTTDNRRANLRLVTKSGNGLNRHRPNKNSTHGFLGVSRNRGRWAARINVEGRALYLGTFDTPEEAATVAATARAAAIATPAV